MKFLAQACLRVYREHDKLNTWIFDFDNTLFNSRLSVFPIINERMTQYIQEHVGVNREEANHLRNKYWKQYGATLLGLVAHHHIDAHHFLKVTHDVGDFSRLASSKSPLVHLFRILPGDKLVFSNSPNCYLTPMLRQLGIEPFVTQAFSIESTRLNPKPSLKGFRAILKQCRLDPRRSVMIEDSIDNLLAAKQLGMKTVFVSPSLCRPSWVDAVVRRIY